MTYSGRNLFYHTPLEKFKRAHPVVDFFIKFTCVSAVSIMGGFIVYQLNKSPLHNYDLLSHTVCERENIYNICKGEGLTGDAILDCVDFTKTANNLEKDTIYPGQKIKFADANKDGKIGINCAGYSGSIDNMF